MRFAFMLPLAAFAAALAIIVGSYKKAPRLLGPALAISAAAYALFHSLWILKQVWTGLAPVPFEQHIPWFSLPSPWGRDIMASPLAVSVSIDGLTAAMLVIVSLVSLLVFVYSQGYMEKDPAYNRYFALMSFFMGSMLALVLSGNLFQAFAFWEFVGIASYLLIGFWYEKPEAAYAAKKAFITTRLGDMGFYLALLLLAVEAGTLDISSLKISVAQGYLPAHAAVLAAFGILAGAAGKSAQGPLLIWLPDAMEGPTPVSALIHAATMVAAGVYLVARCHFLFDAGPLPGHVVLWLGALTSLAAGAMALGTTDIKRVLAFSTISQLGFMMAGLGLGGITLGMFHLATHAFFKALLFLCAGCVIHAVHTNDMRQMGGLSRKMPLTFLATAIGACALAGIPFFSGFYSKDPILETAFESARPAFWALFAAEALTPFYIFRLLFMTFLGDSRDTERHQRAEEAPAVMLLPLAVLSVLSIALGPILAHNGLIETLLAPGSDALAKAQSAGSLSPVTLGGSAVALAAAAAAWRLYGGADLSLAALLKEKLSALVSILSRRLYLDDAFLALVSASDAVAYGAGAVDLKGIDGAVDGVGLGLKAAGRMLRTLTANGLVQEYIAYAAMAFSLLAVFAGSL